jgi:hypothetical protein
MKHNFEIGQKVLFVRKTSVGTEFNEKEITKIGERWVHVQPYDDKFDKDTLEVYAGNYTSEYSVYLSKEHYDETIKLREAWRDFYSKITWIAPEGMTLEQINKMNELLSGEE